MWIHFHWQLQLFNKPSLNIGLFVILDWLCENETCIWLRWHLSFFYVSIQRQREKLCPFNLKAGLFAPFLQTGMYSHSDINKCRGRLHMKPVIIPLMTCWSCCMVLSHSDCPLVVCSEHVQSAVMELVMFDFELWINFQAHYLTQKVFQTMILSESTELI